MNKTGWKKQFFLFLITLMLLSSGLTFIFFNESPFQGFLADVVSAEGNEDHKNDDSWWNGDWSYRKSVIIDHSKVSGNLVNFPMLINITDSDLRDDALNNGNDIVFTDDEGNKLSHEIELYNGTNGKLLCWVNVTSLSSSVDTVVYMYYGNPSASNQENPVGVWDSGYAMVQHLNENTGTHYDSTSFSNDGAVQGDINQDVLGMINGGDEFDGDGDYVDVTDDTSLDVTTFTLSFWAKAHQTATGNWYIVDKREQNQNDYYLNYGVIWNYGGGFVAARSGDGNAGTGVLQARWDSNPSRGVWHHFIAKYDGSTLSLYVDGDQKAALSQSFTPYSTNNDVINIGRCGYSTAYRYFDGFVDEIRISTFARSEAWIETEYNNQHDPNSFINIGGTNISPDEPVVDDEIPVNGSVDIAVGTVALSVLVNDSQSDDMDVYFKTNASGSWSNIDSNLTVTNGTYSQTYKFNDYGRTYWWSVNVTDPLGSGNWTNETYHFTTEIEPGIWWDENWHYRKMIRIDHSKFDENLLNFPLLLNVTDTEISDKAQINGNDLVFTDYTGSKLHHEVEYFNSTTGNLIAWVNLPFVSCFEDTILYLYYGNSLCGYQGNPSSVWDSNYVMVQHLHEINGSHVDSTGFGNDAFPHGDLNQNTTGKINGADDFDGIDDYLSANSVIDDFDLTQPWTISGWVRIDNMTQDKFFEVTSSSEYVWVGVHDDPDAFKIGSNAKTPGIGNSYVTDSWYHIVLVWNGSHFILYENGVEDYSVVPTDGGSFLSSLNMAVIGAHYDSSIGYDGFHNGTLDEVRISNVERNLTWITACYHNQLNPSQYCNLQDEEISLGYPAEPQIFNPYPSNGANNVQMNPLLSVDVYDYQSDEVNLTFMTNESGNWQQIGSFQSGYNGTYNQTTSVFNSYNIKYWWSVNVTDPLGSGNWTNKTFSFTTEPVDIYFTVDNAAEYYTSCNVHAYDPDGMTTDDIVHVDLLYFPFGWGDVNGSSYKYWLANTPFPGNHDDYENPCILVSNNLTNDSWSEPADNYWDTNPITDWVWNDGGSGGHYSDCDIVYNDDTDELYYYFRNSSGSGGGWKRVELMKSSDGVNWTWVSQNVNVSTPASSEVYDLSPAVVKQGDVWHMWIVNSSKSPNVIEHWTSSNGTWFEFDCVWNPSFVNGSFQPWHVEVNRYNDEYWGVVNEQPNGNLYLIKSSDGCNWTAYGDSILSTSSSGWDSSYLYRSTYLIEDNHFEMVYVGVGNEGHHIAYTDNKSVVGSGVSSNVIEGIAPEEPQINNPTPSNGESYLDFNPLLSIDVIDYQGEELNVSFMTNESGNWQQIGSFQSGYNGTYNQTTLVFDNYDTMYWWSVNISDGAHWVNKTYYFTTSPEKDLWWNNTWQYRKNISINNSLVMGNDLIENFPLLIDIFDEDLKEDAQENGNDIVFTNMYGTKLDHEIEYFNGSSGELICWVKVDMLNVDSNTTIYMYYGNLTCSSQEDSAGVWSGSYRMVHHLDESSGTHFDSTLYNNDGVPQGGLNQSAEGKINGADNFDGTDDGIDISLSSSLDFSQTSISISGWFKTSSTGGQRIISLQDNTDGDPFIFIRMGHYDADEDSINDLEVSFNDANGNARAGYVSDCTQYNDNKWHHIFAVYNNNDNSIQIYIDGLMVRDGYHMTDVLSAGFDCDDSNTNWHIGYEYSSSGGNGGKQRFLGTIDEVRLSDVARKYAWVQTCYNNQNNSNNFYNTGSEELAPTLDSTPPEISNIDVFPDPQIIGNNVNISCSINDNIGVDEVRVNISYPDDSVHNETMTEGSYYYNATYSIPGEYSYFIWANDTSGNSNQSELYTFNIVDLDLFDHVDLTNSWNLVSLPVNDSVDVSDVFIVVGDQLLYWDDAVDAGVVLGFLYEWSSSLGQYQTTSMFEPGLGCWLYAFDECVLLVNGSGAVDGSVADVGLSWNLIGLPDNGSVWKTDLIVEYNGHDYSWYEATTGNNEMGEPLVLSFIYAWDDGSHQYQLTDVLHPGHGYWMYGFYECVIKT